MKDVNCGDNLMGKMNCLNFDQLFRLMQDNKDSNMNEELIKINDHIQNCQSCKQKLIFLQNLNGALKKNPKRRTTYSDKRGDHLSPELMERYFQGSLFNSKIDYVYNHLASCSDCLREFNYLANSEQPERSEVDAVMARIEAVEVKDRLARYLTYFTRPTPADYLKQWLNGLKTSWQGLPSLVRATVSFAAAVILTFLIYQGYQTFQFQKAVQRAFLIFIESNMIKDNELRPTGGFPYQPFSTKSKNPQKSEQPDYAVIVNALQKDPQDARLNHYLGTICFFEGKIQQAEEYYLKALALDKHKAEIYNDLALIDVNKKDFQKAIDHLEQAIKLKPELPEARYNMAAIWELLGEKEKAIAAWKTYLESGSTDNSDWYNVARDRLSELSN